MSLSPSLSLSSPPPPPHLCTYSIFLLILCRSFTKQALLELERFHEQKVADFRSLLVNFVQLQMHMHRKVSTERERALGGMGAQRNERMKELVYM